MTKFKKIVALVLALVLVFALAACGGNTDTDPSGDGTSTGEKQPMPAIAKDDIKVGVLHIGDPADGAGYSYAHDSGIVEMQKAIGLRDDQIIRKNNVADDNDTAIETALNELIEAGCNIIFATSWGYMEKVNEAATAHPEIIFSHCSGYMSNDTNFNNYFGQIYQARYLAGIVAGLKTKSNKIGYVAAQDNNNPEVTGGIDAFALGVKSVNPDAKVYVKVTNTWFDLQKEKAAAVALLDEGCDVITQHQDTTQPMVAAQERGAYGIGYNSDMALQVPKAVLTSVVWHWGVYYTAAVQAAIDGKWTADNYFKGMNEKLLGLTELTDLCAEGTKEKVDEATQKILSGELKVFAGEIKDNAGTVRVKAGESLDDAYIAGQINWYVDNVVVK